MSVGALRTKVIAEGAPCVQDVVVAGLNRSTIAVLLVPRLDACAKLTGVAASLDAATLLREPAVRAFFQRLVDGLWRGGTGSASKVARAVVLIEPPSIDTGEITDKGSINQRVLLTRRMSLVDAMYRGDAPDLILPQCS